MDGTDDTDVRERTRRVQAMFARIVPRYDRMNQLMSLGMDAGWRRRAAKAAEPSGKRALDVGTGTGDLSAALVERGAALVVGADVAPLMLRAASRKRHAGAHEWCVVDARHLPFRDASFDAVTNAFLLRNLPDLAGSLREMVRVLRPEGLLVCLDMTPPPRTASGMAFQLYFRRLMPPIAGVLSGDREAYRYLPDSLEGFPDANALAGLLRGAGLADVTCDRLAAGGVALHVARKPA